MFIESRLSDCLTSEFLEAVRVAHHYGAADAELLSRVAADMAICLKRQECIYLVFREPDEPVVVCMTLGGSVDVLQERYQRKGRMLESYMVEHIGGALLAHGYQELAGWLCGRTGRYVAAYHFFGGEEGYPLEDMAEALALAGPCRINCTEAFCLKPRQSAVFLAELSEKPPTANIGICERCNRYPECVGSGDSDGFHKLN